MPRGPQAFDISRECFLPGHCPASPRRDDIGHRGKPVFSAGLKDLSISAPQLTDIGLKSSLHGSFELTIGSNLITIVFDEIDSYCLDTKQTVAGRRHTSALAPHESTGRPGV